MSLTNENRTVVYKEDTKLIKENVELKKELSNISTYIKRLENDLNVTAI